MWVVSKSRLREFWESPDYADSAKPLQAWYHLVGSEDCDWKNWADVKAIYADASLVGDCVVFNIGGNKYRLITRIRYKTHKVYVLKVLTHSEYDTHQWKSDCGCFDEPPDAKKASRRTPRK